MSGKNRDWMVPVRSTCCFRQAEERVASARRRVNSGIVIAGLNWFARLGFTPGAGYSLSMPSDGAGWANAASYVTVTTAMQHFARTISRLATYMVGPDGAGLYHIRMDDYNDLRPFMFGFLAYALYAALPAPHLGVATDHVIESFRNRLWPGYKMAQGVERTTRSTPPPELV